MAEFWEGMRFGAGLVLSVVALGGLIVAIGYYQLKRDD